MIPSPAVGNLPPEDCFDLQGQGRLSQRSNRFSVTWTNMEELKKKKKFLKECVR